LESRSVEELNARFKEWLGFWGDKWGEPALVPRVTIEFSSRLTRSLGRAYPKRMLIRISTALTRQSHMELLKMVLCHEFAHLAVFHRHGHAAKAHGQEWRKLIRIAGFNPSATYKAERPNSGTHQSKSQILYMHRCPVCGTQRLAKKPMLNWRCIGCAEAGLLGKLQITTQPIQENG